MTGMTGLTPKKILEKNKKKKGKTGGRRPFFFSDV